MIYCYYDKNGVLREIINNESTRQGASESRAIIRVYFELHKEITDMTALYKTGDYTTATQRYSAGIIETIVPYNSKINYKYFKDNTPYTFFEFEIPSDILEKGANDFSTNVSCTFTPYYNNEEWDKLGLLTFNLQASVLNIDDTLTTSQMDYLLAEISKFEFIKNNGVYGTTDTSIVNGANAYSVHTNGCFVLQYVEATSQSVPAKNIAGIRFYRVVNNRYSLLYSSVEETDILYKLEQSDITQNYQITTLLNDVARLKEVFLDFATKEELSRVAFSGNYNDLSNKPSIPTQLSELTNNVGFITNAVSDLVNYYKKTETFTKDEITAKLNAIKTIKFEIYASLDDITNPQSNVIYLIGTASPYKEYAYIEGVGFELIGSTDIDLSNYVQSDNTLNTDYVVLGNADKKVKTSSYKIETSSLNNTGIPTTHLVQTELRKYHDIITINGDSGTVLNIATHTPYRIIVDENLLVYRRVKNGTNPVFEALELVDNTHTKTWFLTFVGNNYTRTSVENVDHNEFDELVANTPTEITYNKETKVAQLTHDGQPIGEGAIIDLDGFTPYFDGSGLVLSDLEHAENDLATKQDKIESVKIVAPNTATSGTFTSADLQTLLKNKLNYVEFNNENFYPQDVEIEQGYIVYSHVGQIGSETKIKNINLTIATGGWVLTETSLVSAPISIVNELPEANEENYQKGKIYTTGELLQYISKVALSEPNVSTVGNAEGSSSPNSATNIGNDIYYHVGNKQLYKLNTQTFTFTQLPFTSENGDLAQIISVGTDIYLFGGDYYVNTGNKKICKYNTLTNEYTFLKNLPDFVEQMGIAKVGTDIYLFGGHRSGNYLMSTIYKYDTNTNTLYTVNATLPAQMQGICAVAYGTDIYLFGGSPNTSTTSTSGLKNTIIKFDTITNSLTTLDITLPTGIAFTTGQVIGDSIYLFGGLSNGKKVQKFNPTTNEITTLPSVLPDSKGVNVCSAVIGDNVYIMGGGNFSIVKAEFGFNYQYKTISTQ